MIDNLLFSRLEISGFCFFHFLFKAFSWSSQCTNDLFFDLCISWRRIYTEKKTIKECVRNKEIAFQMVGPPNILSSFFIFSGSTYVYLFIGIAKVFSLLNFQKRCKKYLELLDLAKRWNEKYINFYFLCTKLSNKLVFFKIYARTHLMSCKNQFVGQNQCILNKIE